MLKFTNSLSLLEYTNQIKSTCDTIENSFLKGGKQIQFYCSICKEINYSIKFEKDEDKWTDLRGKLVCSSCGFNMRHRLFYDVFELVQNEYNIKSNSAILLFEAIGKLYNLLSKEYDNILGVEYIDSSLKSGAYGNFRGKRIMHQDMQDLSFADESFDCIIHLEVLEHVANHKKAIEEIKRCLKPGGVCVFMCPIYSRLNHINHAFLDIDKKIKFTNGPKYHGDPLRKGGAPVFNDFGMELLEEINSIGLKAQFYFNYSLVKAYFSNNNPYQIGHCWPLVILCQKL